jgi:hypothetical protein
MDRLGPLAGIAAMLEQDRLDARMMVEQANQFGAAIAAEPGDASAQAPCRIIIHCTE